MLKASIFDLSGYDANGNYVDFGKFKGQVLLVTNAAHSNEREAETFRSILTSLKMFIGARPFSVLVFPCFQFGNAEKLPDFRSRLSSFVVKDKVIVMDEVQVNGPNTADVFKFLKARAPGNHGGIITSNFTWFLVDSDGTSVQRFPSHVHPYVLQEAVENSLLK